MAAQNIQHYKNFHCADNPDRITTMTKKRILIAVLMLIAVVALLGSGFSLGFKAGKEFPETILVQGVRDIDSGKPTGIDFGTFWQAWQTIDQEHLNYKDASNKDRLYGAIRGLVGALKDPYSEFLKPEDNQKFREDIQGSFGGIGAELGIRKDRLVIVAPLKDTPAMKAGLQAGDQILAVNASSTFGITIDQAVKWIRGLIGEPVTLTIMRDAWEKPKDIEIVRANIVIPTLEVEILDNNITHVQLYSFNANAERLFYDATLDALKSGSRGMILDLRNNPGGYLEVAVNLAGWFLPRGSLVVSQEGRGGSKQEFRANGNSSLANFPLVILINRGSASASEILAGAIKIHRDNVKLVGETTFGKGTVQELEPLRDGSSLKLTVAHWVLPNGQVLEEEGLEPDFEVEITEEDFENERDPQLEKAIEVLETEISR